MKCICNVRCRLYKDIDMFGKEPELYYKTRPKKTSWIGRILSFLFVTVYFAFFLYKLIKMMKRVDVTFYDTFTYAPSPPQVPITHNNFYVGFALEDPETYNPFIDEGIYYVKAFFKRAEMKGDEFVWDVKELEVEQCQLSKFGESYRDVFKNVDLKNYYCFSDINNLILEGHFSYLLYSFFYIEFYPCINTTEKKTCKPIEKIDYFLANTFVSFEIENIELTPKNFKQPIRPRNADVYTTVGKKLFQEIHVYLEVVNIETDLDWFGFDEFENIKSEIYLKYDESFIMSNIIDTDIYETGEKFCDVTFKLSEDVRTQRRVYTKFVTILGDVGGLMEVIFTLFRIISSFSVDILYEVSMVNRLFKFDLDKKRVSLKESDLDQFKPLKVFSNKEKEKLNEKLGEKLREKEGEIDKQKKNQREEEKVRDINDVNIINLRKSTSRKKVKQLSQKKLSYNVNNNELNSLNISSSKSKTNFNVVEIEKKTINDITKMDESNEDKNVVSKVRMNRACIYFWFCFVRRRRIMENVLLNEGMDLISRRLDIFNIFEKIYRAEQRNEPLLNKSFPMSNECRTGVKLVQLETSLY